MKRYTRLYTDKNITLIKYFLSYFIILSMLFLGFFFAVRIQLNNIYFKNLNEQTDKRLNTIMEQLENNLIGVNQVQSMLTRDINLVLFRYKNEDWYGYQAAQRMSEYTVSNSFIDTIVYADYRRGSIFSSGKHVYEKEGIYYIYTGTHYLPFPIHEYTDSNSGQLVYLSDKTSGLLIYLPYNSNNENYSIFYVISANELMSVLESSVFTGIESICLMTPEHQLVSGINKEALLPYLDSMETEPGPHKLNGEETMFLYSGIPGGLSLVALSSNKAILAQVNLAFRNTYLILVLLASFGVILILFSMRLTYWPLHQLLTRMVDKPQPGRSYVEQIDDAFNTAISENKVLQNKLDKYRGSMQKSILDSIVSDNNNAEINRFLNIDQFFSDEPDNKIFILKITSPQKKIFVPEEVMDFLDNSLPDENSCALLEAGRGFGVFMINYPGIERNKDEVVCLLMSDYCQDTGCRAAVSNAASSPLEIPSLYENVMLADKYSTDDPVIYYPDIADSIPSGPSMAYPYRNLDALAFSLKTCDFLTAHKLKEELFEQINGAADNGSLFPDFFIHCVLIDILTVIINSMNRMNIRFKNYNELYFETLYLCRSCPYEEKKEEISRNMDELLIIFESEYENSAIHACRIQEILQEEFASPDFSISTLADKFQISIAYMSYLFKKKFNRNFSDYLWDMRLKKAEDLLLHTDMSIEQISASVGYINVSSFRRKFKQEIGMTPSAFREGKE